MAASSSSDESDDDVGEKIRVSLHLSSDCLVQNPSLQVNSDALAVPATIGRKGLSAVVNHLLNRKLQADDDDSSDDGDDERLPALDFDFILGSTNRLLRTGVEREARRSGLTLEEAIPVTYFPAMPAPELQPEQGDPLPDWISDIKQVDDSKGSSWLVTATYDGSLQVMDVSANLKLTKVATSTVHQGAIKSMDAVTAADSDSLLIASGAMDHSLSISRVDKTGGGSKKSISISTSYHCESGHSAAVGSVSWQRGDGDTVKLASGDWNGTLCIWDIDPSTDAASASQEKPSKKSKQTKTSAKATSTAVLSPHLCLPQAHASKISGISWGNWESSQKGDRLLSASWDHSLKLWDVERQDCLMTLNAGKVMACMDTSYNSKGVVATGHPDGSIRLWDVRDTDNTQSTNTTDTLKGHRTWVTSVQWSKTHPYRLASTSHDGTVKVWDLRSPSIPLHSVRAFHNSQDKGLCLAYHAIHGSSNNSRDAFFVGGSDCIVKQFSSE